MAGEYFASCAIFEAAVAPVACCRLSAVLWLCALRCTGGTGRVRSSTAKLPLLDMLVSMKPQPLRLRVAMAQLLAFHPSIRATLARCRPERAEHTATRSAQRDSAPVDSIYHQTTRGSGAGLDAHDAAA